MGIVVSKCRPNLLHNLYFKNANMEKVRSSSTNPSTYTTTISTTFKYSLSHSMNKALLLIVTHNLVTRLISKGSTIAFGAYIFMVSLNMHICKSKRLASKGLQPIAMRVSALLFHNNVSL
jgi:hypothetical protein